MYDAVIVGAGLAGLTAAERLGTRKVLVLEREDRCGGRVFTGWHDGIPFERGAIFAGDDGLDGDTPLPMLGAGAGGVVLQAGGQWIAGDTPLACLRAALAGQAQALDELGAFAAGTLDARQVGEPARRLLDAFFHVVHPGAIESTVRARQGDALALHARGFPADGNAARVSRLLGRLAGRVITGADVVRVDEQGDWVRVEYLHDGQSRVARSRAVVVATPPGPALRMLRGADVATADFLGAVRFLPGMVCAVGLKADDARAFSYLASTDAAFNTVIQRRPDAGDMTVLHVYYLGARRQALAERCAGHDAATVVVEDLRKAGVITPAAAAVFVDLHDWAGIGPEISGDAYGRSSLPFVCSPRVFLAGDYTWFDRAERFPFGMGAAIRSGWRAADAVSALLAGGPVVRRETAVAPAPRHRGAGYLPPLLHGTVYELGAQGPRFLRHVVEGNIAYYGLLLQASGDRHLASYLVDKAVGDLWEFHAGFGVTAADSALVLDGLLAAGGCDPDLLQRAAGRLVARFYVDDKGAFATVAGGRAAYWSGVSVETTAHVAWLLHRIDPVAWREPVERSARYVRRQQQSDGHWEGRWYPSHLIPTYYALRLLVGVDDGASAERMARARDYLLRTQLDNGSWSHLVIDTAVAVLALALTGDAEVAIARARAWIRRKLADGEAAGEPVLYYWYDTEGDTKTFFSARDAGGIARAWAALALGGLPAAGER